MLCLIDISEACPFLKGNRGGMNLGREEVGVGMREERETAVGCNV